MSTNTDRLTRERWETILHDARGYLGLDDDDPVPVDELLAQVEANGYDDEEARDALRETDELESADGDLDDLHVRLAAESNNDETTEEDTDIKGENPGCDGEESAEDVGGIRTPSEPDATTYRELNFSATDARTWAPAQIELDSWMCRKESKAPYAPWTDADAPVKCTHEDHAEPTTCAECDHPAGYKWGSDGSREHVHSDHATALEWADMDPTLSSDLAFIQRESDPFVFVDGDDVRDPETGEVHPVFEAFLDHLGVTYTDVSTSGSGVHAVYRGEIPLDGVLAPTFKIDDEPWGANDDPPAFEVYDGKHVCIATGDHVVGSGTKVAEWDTDAATAIFRANGFDEHPEPTADHSVDLSDHNAEATSSDETADDIRDIFLALDRLDPKDVADQTIVDEWTRGKRSFLPVWGSSRDNGTANYVDDKIWHDTGSDGGYGGPAVMAAIDAGLVHHTGVTPRDVSGETFFEAIDHLRELGFSIPELDRSPSNDSREEADHRTDPRERDATVDMRRAWDAAGRVTPDELEADLALDHADDGEAWIAANGDRVGDVVRAVALDAGMIDTADADLDDYPAAYNRAREEYGAPIPRYYTTADAIAEFDAVLDVIGEVTYWDLDVDAFASDVTEEGDDVGGDGVRALNPSWRESESEASVIIFDSGTVWDADTERVLDAVRFVALDSGLIESPEEPLEGEAFTEAYARTRTEYGAPLPRWEPAADGRREITPQLPRAEDLLDTFEYDDGVDTDALEAAREDVEDLVGELVEDTGEPSVITSLPATGKTTSTIKTAGDRPLSYLAPRKELQAQALDKAEKWGVDAEILPVYCDETIRDEVLDAAIQHVRSAGKDRLRDRWAILTTALEAAGDDSDVGDLDPEDIFVDEEEADGETVDLDRPTCETARGDHGVAWALVVHIARALGYTPREIHQHAEGLFGASLPCDAGEATCEYTDGWDTVADPDDSPDLLVGSYVHAHVESARTAYSRDHSGDIERTPRSIVLDEFPGEAFVREFDGEAVDHATWLARSLVDHVADRRDMRAAQLHRDEWVRAWLDGRGDEVIPTTIRTLERVGLLFDAREAAAEILDEVDSRTLDELGIEAALEAVRTGNAAEAYNDLAAGIEAVDPEQPAAGVARWADEAVREPLARATVEGDTEPDLDAVGGDETIPSEGDLRDLVDRAVEAVEEARDDARAAVKAAVTALRGGREGCRQLAAWADDGYAHPDAHHLLEADMTPTGERETVDVDDLDSGQRIYTDSWAFDENATEGTVVDRVETGGKATVVADRNDHGALLHTPPSRESGGGEEAALVGLDATGRAELWATALGEEVDTADIHTTPGERAEFLESALGLRVIQAADRPRPYEGDPTTKDTDGDVALLEAIADEYSGIEAPRSRDEAVDAVGKPAAITTKGVRDVLENDTRLDDVVAEFENYGNVTGANDLGDHRLAAILGSQHYGDHAIERFCALGGEEVDTSRDAGRGAALDYGNDLANTYLQHMREDQTMQAALRFARGDSGATIVARTSALREDLPVVGRGQVVETWSDTATEIARRYRRLGDRFSIGDVADAVDVTKRQVRRVLAELTEAGYLRRVEAGDGIASVYEPSTAGPGAGEVDLPERADAVDSEPGHSASNEYYTWNVRVSTLSDEVIGDDTAEPSTALGAPPSPAVATGKRGPQSGGEGPSI